MIELQGFSFRYSPSHFFALKDISIRILPGEFVLIVGDSGSGKTTLLRAINGLVPHFYGGEYRGKVIVEGKEVSETSPRKLAAIVGSVFQDPENQILMSTVEREISFPLENRGMKEAEIEKRVEEALELLGIYHLRERKIESLSGGEKQKVAIAAAMASYPRYLLLDEPTSQIDPNSAEELLALLERLNDDLGIGIVLVEHRMERTMHRADRLIVMNAGKIICDGEPRMVASKIDLDALGIGYPQITRVARKMELKYLPLTVKEGRKALSHLFGKVKITQEKYEKEKVGEAMSLSFSYDGKRVIRDLTLELFRGEVLGLMGRNGAGKTTLAKLLSGLLKPQRGKIRIMGKDIAAINERERSKLVSMVFQNPNVHLFQDTIYDDIALSSEDNEKVKSIMKKLGIWKLKDRSGKELSGGERMLAAIASIAVKEPELLILDEPTRGLSYRFKRVLSSYLRDYASRHSVILISHDVEMIARTVQRVAILSRGKIIVEGNKRDILSSSLIYSTQLNKVAQGIPDADKRVLIEEDLEGVI